ncbi:hypothetical protein D7Z26_22055 [Cohnella endophytica]|uniref:Uncharacterized protein n=1 Tax=Cohnella endophytica TaxID=2419778 RepID=A0A494XBG5_9BACL|nr:hypothetical protein [Cohnella endophytica]RKP47900.1 hypothetical protein D7Z26_22055 [Cohnella endophytica]
MNNVVKEGQKTRYILLAVLIIIVTVVIFQLSSRQEKSFRDTTVNEKVIQTKSFHVNSASTDLKTSAKGTVYVRGDNGKAEHIQIVAWIEIDSDDWGGVAFYIPDKWHVSNIISSYPDNGTRLKPADYVSTWTTASGHSEWRTMIEVGRDRSYKPTGGGTGTVMIDIIPDENGPHHPEVSKIGVEVGSNEKEGQKMMGTDSIEIPLSLADQKYE